MGGSPGDGPAEPVGVTEISVGVGTGGSSGGVNVTGAETGDASVVEADGAAEVGTGAAEGAVASGGTALVAGRTVACASVSGCEVPARRGAFPIPSLPLPAPRPPESAGAPTWAGLRAGVASVQPAATAIGSPSATSPKKMDLGDNRTWVHRATPVKSYAFRKAEMRSRSSARLVQSTAGRSYT